MCGVIVVDAESFRSTLSRTWCLCLWSCLDILITMRFSINFSAVICSPTIRYAILREATSETYGPRVYFKSYKFPIYNSSLLLFCNLYFLIYTTKIPKIFILLSLLDPTFVIDREGIDNPFIALVARFLIVCEGTRRFACSLLLDWYLGSQKLREILTLPCCITLSSSREKPTQCSRGSMFLSKIEQSVVICRFRTSVTPKILPN